MPVERSDIIIQTVFICVAIIVSVITGASWIVEAIERASKSAGEREK